MGCNLLVDMPSLQPTLASSRQFAIPIKRESMSLICLIHKLSGL